MADTSHFPFVKNTILRKNLDEAFDYIVTLLPFTESSTYNNPAKSAFRKTIIIYTASIVEALLFHLLDGKLSCDEIADYYSRWELRDRVNLYSIDETHIIVAGHYRRALGESKKEKLNLAQINTILKEKKITSKILFDKVDVLKTLRNEQHIGTHTEVKTYSKADLEKAFSVASTVKDFVRKNV